MADKQMINGVEVTPELKQAWASAVQSDNRQALAELIVEFVQPNHVVTDYMNLLLDTRRLQPGDALVKKVRKGIEVRTLVPGAVHLASELTVTDRMNYILDGASVKVTYNQWEMERGEIGTLAEIVREMRAQLSDYYLNKVFTALTSVWTAGRTPNNYTSLGTAITASALQDAIEEVNYRGGGAKVIFGTRKALQPITGFGGFWDTGTTAAGTPHAPIPGVLEEIRQTGWVGRYYGVPVVGIDQVWDNPEDFNSLLPEDKVLVVGHKAGEFITFGDARTKSWTDMNPTPPQEFIEIYSQFGMIVDNAQGVYVIGGIV